MALVDSQGTVFTFDGIPVANVIQYDFRDGTAAVLEFNSLEGGREERPGTPVYGDVRISVAPLDLADAGIQRMQQAYDSQEKDVPCSITRTDGTGFTFPSFVRSIPLSGAITGTDTSVIVIRCAGAPTPL